MSALPLGADIDVGVRNFAGISIGPCWRGPQCTAAPTTQWVYSRVSRASLQKTGVFLDSAGDFWEFSTQKVRTSVSRDYWRREKPAFGGPFSSKEGNSLKRGMPGWGASLPSYLCSIGDVIGVCVASDDQIGSLDVSRCE